MKTLDYISLDPAATKKTITGLQQLLANYQIYYTNMRGFHWDVQGKQFFTLHIKFEELYKEAALIIDEIAERILALGGIPENRFSEYLKTASIKELSEVTDGEEIVGHLLDAYKIIIKQERDIISQAEKAEDQVTVDMLTEFLTAQEKLTWMLCAYMAK